MSTGVDGRSFFIAVTTGAGMIGVGTTAYQLYVNVPWDKAIELGVLGMVIGFFVLLILVAMVLWALHDL